MRIPEAKIEKAVSKDATRPVLTRLYLRISERVTGRGRSRRVHREGHLEATDTYKLVRVPVKIADDDVQGFIPVEALTRARKQKLPEITAAEGVRVGDVTFDRPADGTFPDAPSFIPEDENIVFRIGVNAVFLRELAEALGSDQVVLEFQGQEVRTKGGTLRGVLPEQRKPIRVSPLDQSGPVGVLMPVLLRNSKGGDQR
jgi:hypothetical protein